MAKGRNRLLVVQVAGLGWDLLQSRGMTSIGPLVFGPAEGMYPALTCTVQAGFRTAAPPGRHGVVGNGFMDRSLRRVLFWEQSAALVEGARIWDVFARAGRRVGMLFWQQSLGERLSIVLSPAPVHPHHGRLIQAVYSRPAGLYERVRDAMDEPFDLQYYWGPRASTRSSQWIADATAALMSDELAAPDLLLTYLPALDYDLQRYGPGHRRAVRALRHLASQLDLLSDAAGRFGYEMLVYGDYAIAECPGGAAYLNRELLRRGLLSVRWIRGMSYPDLHESRAFAVVDHELAHVYVRDPADVSAVRNVVTACEGVGRVMDRGEQSRLGVNHVRSGDLLVEAAEGRWFAYDWWQQESQAPDYAGHVDIHNKPGYDPLELFWGWPPGRTSRNARRICGSHGRTGPGREVAIASTFHSRLPETLLDAARDTATWLQSSL